MQFSPPLTIKLQVKSPIFIGDGESVTPLSYVTEKNTLHVLNVDRILASLTPDRQDAYLKWMEPVIQRLAELDTSITFH